ncbi:MAG TPA: DUF5698 domain-containing protein [Longimicrobium sp.]|nr:DUF5698 domain-containing protein [Longimicrobium sp.]
MTLDTVFGSAWGPLAIFALRIVDVSLATVRMLLAVRGHRRIVPVIGFFEVLLWIVAVGNAVKFLDSPLHLLGYAGGYAMGTAVGLWIEEKMALGLAALRVMSRHGGVEIAEALREHGFGVTEFGAQGKDGRMEVLYAVLRRRDLPLAIEQVSRWDPAAFVTVEEPRSIHRGWLTEVRRK